MAGLIVPALDERSWPTLGPQVCDFIEAYAVYGPGDLKGEPARLDPEKRAFIYRAYEVYPTWHPEVQAGRIQAGRRRFKLVTLMLQKGTAKTELAAWIAFAELDPDGPVRFDGWDAHGEPVGRPIVDPYIPMYAYNEEQAERLAYGALYVVVSEGPRADLYDIGLKRIMRKNGDGKVEALTGSPNAADGARTSFSHSDETHRWELEHLREAYRVNKANLPKRFAADAWNLSTTTAYQPGAGSVAEQEHEYALQVDAGKVKNPSIFFFYRGAGDDHDLTTEEGFRDAVIEAAGITAGWRDIPSIVAQFHDPTAEPAYLERVWGNRIVRQGAQAFDLVRWKGLALSTGAAAAHSSLDADRLDLPGGKGWSMEELAGLAGEELRAAALEMLRAPWLPRGLVMDPETGRVVPADGELITLGFDGSRYQDATGIVGTHVRTGHQFVVGVWERPPHADADWEVPEYEVEAAMAMAFGRWSVWRLYADPPYWETQIAEWAGEYGAERVAIWKTNRWLLFAYTLRAYRNAMAAGDLSHDGHPVFTQHIANAVRRSIPTLDDQGKPMWVITKSRPDSPHKIDLAVAGDLSWEARTDAITAGAALDDGPSIYEQHGLLSV